MVFIVMHLGRQSDSETITVVDQIATRPCKHARLGSQGGTMKIIKAETPTNATIAVR